MFFRRSLSATVLDVVVEFPKSPLFRDARLVRVVGSGTLKTTSTTSGGAKRSKCVELSGDGFDWERTTFAGKTLIQTLTGDWGVRRVASGFELERAELPNFESLGGSDVDWTSSVDRLEPILTSLQSGLYVVADVDCFPTDGVGRFFWDWDGSPRFRVVTSSDYEDDRGDADVLNEGEFSDWLYYGDWNGGPAFLYPAFSSANFDENRVEYWRERLRPFPTEPTPRAVVYGLDFFGAVLLDGYAKACAAALLGRPLSCFAILPATSFIVDKTRPEWNRVEFGSFFVQPQVLSRQDLRSIPVAWKRRSKKGGVRAAVESFFRAANRSNESVWEPTYVAAARRFPTLVEYWRAIYNGVFSATNDEIDAWLNERTEENAQKLNSLVFAFERAGDVERVKKIGLRLAELECERLGFGSNPIKKRIFRTLANLKNDPDVEEFFIRRLVADPTKEDETAPIIDTYWRAD